MSAPLVVNVAGGAVWLRQSAVRDGLALYAPEKCGVCPEFVMVTYAELEARGIVGSADVVPVPVGPEPRPIAYAAKNTDLLLADAAERSRAAEWPWDMWCRICHIRPTSHRTEAEALEAADRHVQSCHAPQAEVHRLMTAGGLAEFERLTARIVELERTVQQMVDGLNGHDCPPPGETPMGAVTRFAVRLMEAERLLAELEAAPTFVYRAEHPDSGIALGVYSTRDAAAAHCEALATREGATGLVSWVPDDGDALSPEELTYFDVEYCDGDDVPVQTCTGYVVTPLVIADEHESGADE